MQAIQSGQMTEEDAEKILMEAAQTGAISEEELMQAMQELQAAGGGEGGAPAGDPAAGPAGMPADAGAPPADMMSDPSLEAKVAAAAIGPDHPMYLQKLASLYADDVKAGYEFAVKLAEEIGASVEDGTKPAPEPKDAKPTLKPAPEVKGEAVGTEAQQPNNGDAKLPAAKTAEEKEPKAEENAEAPAHEKAEGEAQAAPVAEMAGVMPGSPEEKQALLEVLSQMGLTEADLHKLMAAQAPAAPMDPMAAKVASFKNRVRSTLISKIASLQDQKA